MNIWNSNAVRQTRSKAFRHTDRLRSDTTGYCRTLSYYWILLDKTGYNQIQPEEPSLSLLQAYSPIAKILQKANRTIKKGVKYLRSTCAMKGGTRSGGAGLSDTGLGIPGGVAPGCGVPGECVVWNYPSRHPEEAFFLTPAPGRTARASHRRSCPVLQGRADRQARSL